MYPLQAIDIMERRGFTRKQMAQFFHMFPDKGSEYTEAMIDCFEYSVNGPVLSENHPNLSKKPRYNRCRTYVLKIILRVEKTG